MSQLYLLLLYSPMLIIMINNLKSSLAATYFAYECSNTTMFANNSHYETNLNTLFQYLTSNATNRYGYHNATAGVGTNDVIYGNFLCRGDQSNSSCQDCVTAATMTDLPIRYCPNRKVAIIWYDECMVRYSNELFFGILDYLPGYILSNPKNVTGNVSQFTDITDDMLINIANHASGGSDIKYGTGGVVFTSSVRVYGLVQCTPDVSSFQCKLCLTDIIGAFPICKGSRFVRPNCNARFETYQFFDGNVDVKGIVVPSLPPQPPPRSNATRTGTTIISPASGYSKTSTNKVIAIVVGLALLQLDYLQ